MNLLPIRTPSALLPIVMSLAATGLVLGHVAIYGIVHEADEGTPAHIYQLLMALQVPVVAYFAAKWLPQRPAEAARVLALQAACVLMAFAVLYWMEHS